MAAAHSYDLDQLALLQIGQRVVDVGRKGNNIGVVFFGQSLNDLGYWSSITPGENFVRSFVKFDDTFRVEQHAFARYRIDL
jgi:hypothetical protein